jgi:hypothetical protein
MVIEMNNKVVSLAGTVKNISRILNDFQSAL